MMNKDSEVTMANTARCQDKIRRGPCRIPGPFRPRLHSTGTPAGSITAVLERSLQTCVVLPSSMASALDSEDSISVTRDLLRHLLLECVHAVFAAISIRDRKVKYDSAHDMIQDPILCISHCHCCLYCEEEY
ncbi:unnamed protein product [Cercospora beticola]|nr:unnamed protein product [Cercospora beticola]